MALPYINFNEIAVLKRKPKLNDIIVLYDSNLIEVSGDSGSKIKNHLTDNIKFRIIDNIVTDSVVDKKHILIKPIKSSQVVAPRDDDIQLKININNIKQIDDRGIQSSRWQMQIGLRYSF